MVTSTTIPDHESSISAKGHQKVAKDSGLVNTDGVLMRVVKNSIPMVPKDSIETMIKTVTREEWKDEEIEEMKKEVEEVLKRIFEYFSFFGDQ